MEPLVLRASLYGAVDQGLCFSLKQTAKPPDLSESLSGETVQFPLNPGDQVQLNRDEHHCRTSEYRVLKEHEK